MNEKIVVFADGYDRVENPNITKDIQDFSLALNDLGGTDLRASQNTGQNYWRIGVLLKWIV